MVQDEGIRRVDIQFYTHRAGCAAVRLVEAASQHAGQLVLVATGPLTNIALACKLDPSFTRNGARTPTSSVNDQDVVALIQYPR